METNDRVETWSDRLEFLINGIRRYSDTDSVHIHNFVRELLTTNEREVREERDKQWKAAIQNLINISNEQASQDWYDGLRACRSIELQHTTAKP